jgi:hypothetical protein
MSRRRAEVALTPEQFAAFELLVDARERRELECRRYLEHAESLLINQTLCSTVQFHEVRSFAGDADVILAADVLNDTGHVERMAFLWELKAPQCYLFEYDENKNRCRPTPDFMKAENQLLHYAEEAFANDATRMRLGVMNRRNVRAGGIIIGTKDKMLQGERDPRDREKAETALRLRREQLYYAQGIRVLLWDRVLDAVRPITVVEPGASA